MRPVHVEPGERYGSWMVLGEGPRVDDTCGLVRTLRVRCDCGAEAAVRLNALRRGHSTRCRACADIPPAKRKTQGKVFVYPGQRVAGWTVIREVVRLQGGTGRRMRYVLCVCECGAEAEVDLYSLVKGTSAQRCYDCNGRRGQPPASRPARVHFIAGVGSDTQPDQLFARAQLCPTWDDAVQWLAGLYELRDWQRADLQASGFLRLRGQADSAAYVEIMRCDCKTPEVHGHAEAAE